MAGSGGWGPRRGRSRGGDPRRPSQARLCAPTLPWLPQGPWRPCSPVRGIRVAAAQSLRGSILSPARSDWPQGTHALPSSPG